MPQLLDQDTIWRYAAGAGHGYLRGQLVDAAKPATQPTNQWSFWAEIIGLALGFFGGNLRLDRGLTEAAYDAAVVLLGDRSGLSLKQGTLTPTPAARMVSPMGWRSLAGQGTPVMNTPMPAVVNSEYRPNVLV